MAKYKVSFMKIESYEVEAENAVDAEDIALEILNDDEWAFLHEHIDEIIRCKVIIMKKNSII